MLLNAEVLLHVDVEGPKKQNKIEKTILHTYQAHLPFFALLLCLGHKTGRFVNMS